MLLWSIGGGQAMTLMLFWISLRFGAFAQDSLRHKIGAQ